LIKGSSIQRTLRESEQAARNCRDCAAWLPGGSLTGCPTILQHLSHTYDSDLALPAWSLASQQLQSLSDRVASRPGSSPSQIGEKERQEVVHRRRNRQRY